MSKKEWYCVFKRKKGSFIKDRDFKLILYLFFSLITIPFLITLIHESGHMLMALIVGWEVYSVQFTYFPFTFHMASGLTHIGIDQYNAMKLTLVLSAGSFHSLIWGYIFFLLVYKYELPKFIELAFFTYSIVLLIEGIGYIIFDLLFLKGGDWWHIYQLNPIIIYIMINLIIFNVGLFVLYYREIIKKIDIIPE